jgi:ABC-type dipeptide/oligopeptide/nickel transport system ATPase component
MYMTHHGGSKAAALRETLAMLAAVGFDDPERIVRSYPHELSGGMAQRAVIAVAWICRPVLVIADEPTSGLDVTVQSQVLDLMHALIRGQGSSGLIITHDLGIVAQYCDRVIVMLDGEIVESGPTVSVFEGPRHPYTRSLLTAVTKVEAGRIRATGSPAHE